MQSIEHVNAYVICLEKKKEQRCNRNFDSIKRIFPKAEWTNAVDATLIDDNDNRISVYAKYHIRTKVDADLNHLASKGAIGCSLSHIGLWKRIVESNQPAVVIEDDMHFPEEKAQKIRKAYTAIPPQANYASIVHLPWPASKFPITKLITYDSISSRDMIAGTQMYYLTPVGAKILLKEAFPIVTHVDVYIAYMSTVYPKLNAVYYTIPLYSFFEFIRDDIGSSIKHRAYLKKMLPESNSFYYIIGIIIVMLVVSIVCMALSKKR